jgi:hypothetical protein
VEISDDIKCLSKGERTAHYFAKMKINFGNRGGGRVVLWTGWGVFYIKGDAFRERVLKDRVWKDRF